MKKGNFILYIIFASLSSCVTQFIPEVDESRDFMVVDGSITNQNSTYKIKITRVSRFGLQNTISPVIGCAVSVTDDLGNTSIFKEQQYGLYLSDSLTFKGEAGRRYILNIKDGNNIYESDQMEMRSVPEIDSLYAVLEYNNSYTLGNPVPGFQVYLNTGDPADECKFYRWKFEETWEFHIPYDEKVIINRVCWKYALSDRLYLKNVAALSQNRITAFPLNFITTETNRLKVKYSILVNQYSLNEGEYIYWEKIQKTSQNVGGLYDMVPVSIKGNIHSLNNPDEIVLGYFSVTSVSSKRIFIKNSTLVIPNFYSYCPEDTVPADSKISGLNKYVWILLILHEQINDNPPPPTKDYYVLTTKNECVDCTFDGSRTMPPYWNLPEKNTFTHSLFNEKQP
jgi:hypothetical protein